MSIDDPGNPAARELGYCPCCGYRTLPEGKPGSYEVCSVCHWLDDPDQFGDTECTADGNSVCLSTARENFREHGAAVPAEADDCEDPDGFERDPNWPYDR